MPNKIRFCVLCNRYDRINRSSYTRIYTVEREVRLLEGYRRRHNGQELNQPMLNQLVHQKCYNQLVRGLTTNDQLNDILTADEQSHDDNDEEQKQASLIQFRSRMPLPSNVNKQLFERRQRICAVCNRYGYRSQNKMKQIVSNFMANKLAEGYAYRYKRPYGQSFLDAYIHQLCFRKLYASYRYQASKKFPNRTSPAQIIRPSSYCPHGTRSRSYLNKPSTKSESEITIDEPNNLSIEQLLSTRFDTSVATTNPHAELSARSDFFRPCMQRLTPEEIEFYTKKRNLQIAENNTEQLPIIQSSTIETSTTNDPMFYSNQDMDDDQDHSQDWIPRHYSSPQSIKINTAAKIRRRYLRPPPLAKPSNPLLPDHPYIYHNYTQKVPEGLEKLYNWLNDELKTLGYPISMGDVLKKYRELSAEENTNKSRESICRERVRHRLEKYYPTKFIFITPNRREGTFVALNDINQYVQFAIKTAKQEKEKAAETSLVSSIIVPPPPPVDYQRQTCEEIMNAVRKIRLYIRDPKHINTTPPFLMQNLVGLITASERQFDKISQQYDFYRMIDENLFDNNPTTSKHDKNIRNMSLASDLISARHDNRVSQKHFLLADEFVKKGSNCTPKQVITLLNQNGHTCSYKSYVRMKRLRQQTTSEFGEEIIEEIEKIMTNEENSSDSELDLIEL